MMRKTGRFTVHPRALVAAIATAALGAAAQAQVTSTWVSPVDGNWTDPARWSTNPNYPNNGTPPGINYIANVALAGTYTVTLADPVTVSTLSFGTTNQQTLAMSGGTLNVTTRWTVGGTVNHTAGAMNLTTGSLSVADLHGQSIYNHSGGTLNFGRFFEVGVLVGDNARYNMSNSASMNGETLLVGVNFGTGTFTQTGGAVQLSSQLNIADGTPTSVGWYHLSGGTLQVTNPGLPLLTIIGGSGIGTFNQTGGVHKMDAGPSKSISLGFDAGAQGTYLLSGGTLESAANVVGNSGTGTILQSGGRQTIAGVMRLGREASGRGFFALSGNSVLISNGQVNVGSAGFGTFNQSGGNYTVNAPMIISANAVSRGRYTMSGGTLGAQALTISNVGAGTFEQSGGVASFTSVVGNGTIATSGSARFTATSIHMGYLSLADSALVSVRSNGTINLLGTLSFAGGATPSGGTLDLANNDLKIANADVVTVQSQVKTARNNGAWDGPGITSSAAAAASPRNTSLGVVSGADFNAIYEPDVYEGQPVAATDVIVKYTYYGDTDLNGVVNFDDYARTDNGFRTSRTGWLNGDFDYSGAVNFDDYGLIDLAFNTQSGTLRRAISFADGSDRSARGMDAAALQLMQEHFEQFGENYATSFLNAIPEPTTGMLALTGLAASAASYRRRRR